MIHTTKKLSVLSAFFTFVFMMFAVVSPASANIGFDKPEGQEEEVKEEMTFRFANDQLVTFFDTNKELSDINKATQDKMAEAAASQNLTLERFNQIATANRIGALQGGSFTDEEVQAFINLGPRISEIQREQQQLIQQKLEEKGFTSQSYQEIMSEYRSDSNLQAHVRELLRERRRQEILEERRIEAERLKAEEEAQQN